jgi:hypothetical protein
MSVDILPDSRARETRGSIRSPLGNLIPVHCANCGKPWGMVNEKDLTFAFALCDACAETYGDDAHFYKEPDAEFWARCEGEQSEAGIKTPEQLAEKIMQGGNALATLAAEWDAKMRRIT